MTEQKNHAGTFDSGKSRVPFVAGIAVLVVGFVFCRSLSVSGNEPRVVQNGQNSQNSPTVESSPLKQRNSRPVRTAATHERHEGRDTHSGQSTAEASATDTRQAQSPVRAEPTPNVLLQPHPPTVKQAPKEKGSFVPLVDQQGKPVTPSAVVTQNGKFYFLGPKQLWSMEWTQPTAGEPRHAYLKDCHPPATIEKIPVQEFNNMISVPLRKSIVVLSKAGDLFEYFIESGTWRQYRANIWLTGSPDPDYVDLAFNGKDIILIDPERNNIWVCAPNSKYLTPYFREVMPWQVRRGDYYVGDGIGIAYDGLTYLLRKSGSISKFSGNSRANVRQLKLAYHAPGHARLRPSRIITAPGLPVVYVVERENNRVLSIDKKTGHTSHFALAKDSDLRGLAPVKDGFVVVNGNRVITRKLDTADPPGAEIHRRSFDPRLDGIGIPVPKGQLPSHLGVFPGARRLYRYGIHAGVDFFNGAGNKVVMGTPALAADGGKIIRIDRNFKDMDEPTFNRVMSQCARDHTTSDHNEDLFRGCQVWLDHGNRMVTRYAHVDKINAKLKKDAFVNRGDVVGYIGVSGTGQNLPGKAKYPHLHFEIWLDGHYVGYGLTPGETLGVYEDIFGTAK